VRVFMSVDIEGVTGVCHVKQADDLGSEPWREACRLMRGDVDAALAGCVAAGADDIVVTDAHYDGDNLGVDGLPRQVSLISGMQQGLSMMEGVGPDFDAALFVGYHAMAGTEGGVLAHTWDLQVARVTAMDGDGARREIGEFGLNAAVAGAFGVPVVFVSGDDKIAVEARALLPGVEAAVVKQGLTRTAARLFDPETARAAIMDGVARALAEPRPAPLDWRGTSLEVEFGTVQWCDKAAACPAARRLDGRRLLLEAPDYLDVYRAFIACATLAEG
jgi:D-amino peptidase